MGKRHSKASPLLEQTSRDSTLQEATPSHQNLYNHERSHRRIKLHLHKLESQLKDLDTRLQNIYEQLQTRS